MWFCLLDWQRWRLKASICLHSDYNMNFLKLPHLLLLNVERQAVEKHTFMLSALRELLLGDNCDRKSLLKKLD